MRQRSRRRHRRLLLVVTAVVNTITIVCIPTITDLSPMPSVDCASPSTVDAEHRCLMPRNLCPSLRSDTAIIRRGGRRAQIADTAAFAASAAGTDWLDRLLSFRHDDEALAAFPGSTDRARDLIAHARSVGALDDSTECW